MATYRELVYLTLDELKIQTDDSLFEPEHIVFLINKYRPMLLKQRYGDVRKEIPDSNFQTIKMTLMDSPNPASILNASMHYMKTVYKVPAVMNMNGTPRIVTLSPPTDYWGGELTYVNKDRFKYIGYNKFLLNFVYGSLHPDGYLYLKSANNPLLFSLANVMITSIFENPIDANKYDYLAENIKTDILDIECPLEANLVPALVKMVKEELAPTQYTPTDDINNAHEDAPDEADKRAYYNSMKHNRQV